MSTSPKKPSQSHPLLGGLTPERFMRRHWQKKPLLVRGALPEHQRKTLPNPQALLELAKRGAVPTRLIQKKASKDKGQATDQAVQWQLTHNTKKLPSLKTRNWTVLLQGVNLVDAATHALLNRFRFIPDARLDDAMISLATEGGGVGPHFDSYDVFLIQLHGTRRWQISAQSDLALEPSQPLKILQHFEPTQTFDLQAGDLLYLPPRFAHDGVAVAPTTPEGRSADQAQACVTCSIGFRAPRRAELARAILDRLYDKLCDEVDEMVDEIDERDDWPEHEALSLYADPNQKAVSLIDASVIPASLARFAGTLTQRLLDASTLRAMRAEALGEYLSEPKPDAVFTENVVPPQAPLVLRAGESLHLARASQMLFDEARLFINGESYLATGKDWGLMRAFAQHRRLSAAQLKTCSKDAQQLLWQWTACGWCYVA